MIAIAVAALSLAYLRSAPPFVDPAPIDNIVRTSLREWEVPGAAVVVVQHGIGTLAKGYGKRRLGTDEIVGPNTVFPLASCSKAFTTTLAAMLADDGKLSLDDPVRKHLPDFRLADPEADAHVRLRDLFCHRTGLGSHDFLWYRSSRPLAELVRRVRYLPPDAPFRTAFHYQSVAYTAGGFAVARAAGTPWERLCRERIFGPLGMRRATCVTPPHGPSDDVATPHKTDESGKLRPIAWYEQHEPNPAGSVHLSANDLVPWLQFHLDNGSFAGRRLVAAERLAETHAPQFALPLDSATRALCPDTNLLSYALGWLVQDYRGYGLVSHSGMIDGFRVQLTLVPRARMAVGVMVNAHQSRSTNAITNSLLDHYLGLTVRDWNDYFRDVTLHEKAATDAALAERERRRVPNAMPPKPLAEYAGRYDHPAYGTITVTFDGQRLQWVWSAFRAELRFLAGTTFTADGEFLGHQTVEFVPDGAAMFGATFRRVP